MKLTREEAIAEFRKMWNWIADETEKRQAIVYKQRYFIENYLETVDSACYCCEYGYRLEIDDVVEKKCDVCPINFGDHSKVSPVAPCTRGGSPFNDWLVAELNGSWRKAAEYARQIANLPERVVE